MDESAAVKCRRFAANCLKKAKGRGNSAEWRRMAQDWETLAQIHDGLAIVSSSIRAGNDDITDAKKDGRNLPMRRPFANFGDHIRREQADRPGRWNESRLGGDEPRESPS